MHRVSPFGSLSVGNDEVHPNRPKGRISGDSFRGIHSKGIIIVAPFVVL